MQDREPSGTSVESVMRATRLLGCYGQGEPSLTLAELVRRSGYSKTTAYRLLRTLVEAGWLERDEASAFRLTIRLFEIGSIFVESLDLRQSGHHVMKQLSEQCGLEAHLVVPAGGRAVCIERVGHAQTVRVLYLDVGGSQPLHHGGAPRALLAHDEAALLQQLLGLETAASSDSATTGPPNDWLDDLAATRQRGYSMADFGARVGVAALGAPVFDRTGQGIAGLGLCGSRESILSQQVHLVETLRTAADALSKRLGSRQRLTSSGATH